jgi:hypothetical protein
MEKSEKKPNVRKLELIELSAKLKKLVDLGKFENINKAILHHYKSKNEGIIEFNTFKQWTEQGFRVKKGEKGYPIWTKPITKEGRAEQPNPEIPENRYKFFSMCYLFSNLQVEKFLTTLKQE